MSGKLTLENGGVWKHTVPVILLSAAAAILVDLLVVVRLPLEGLAQTIVIALVTYVLFRIFYPAFSQLLPQQEVLRTVSWTLTAETLTIGDDVIPRDTIRQVHCWPNRDALGNRFAGWTVNIETKGKNRVLRSVTDEKLAESSARHLRELVEALGYGRVWERAEASN